MLKHSMLSIFFILLICSLKITYAEDSLEYKLAVINADGYVSKDHITVKRFRSLLDQLTYTYDENRQQIADMSVKAQELLREDGVEESLLNIMEGLNQLFASKVENQKYSEYAGAYVMLRIKGQSHTDAILGLKGILQGLGIH